MSYLVLPLLMESGLYLEAIKIMEDIRLFHRTAMIECGDMIFKACNWANYAKVWLVWPPARQKKN
jgi:hypothetical protein